MTFGRTQTERREQREAERERNLRSLCIPSRSIGKGSYAGSTAGAAPKENVMESATYENAVRAIGRCMRCGRECRPQFCHRDEGKGTGIKTDCREGWAGCADCHYLVGTSGKLPKEERRAEDLRLGGLTRAELLATGAWPKSVPMWTKQLGAEE